MTIKDFFKFIWQILTIAISQKKQVDQLVVSEEIKKRTWFFLFFVLGISLHALFAQVPSFFFPPYQDFWPSLGFILIWVAIILFTGALSWFIGGWLFNLFIRFCGENMSDSNKKRKGRLLYAGICVLHGLPTALTLAIGLVYFKSGGHDYALFMKLYLKISYAFALPMGFFTFWLMGRLFKLKLVLRIILFLIVPIVLVGSTIGLIKRIAEEELESPQSSLLNKKERTKLLNELASKTASDGIVISGKGAPVLILSQLLGDKQEMIQYSFRVSESGTLSVLVAIFSFEKFYFPNNLLGVSLSIEPQGEVFLLSDISRRLIKRGSSPVSEDVFQSTWVRELAPEQITDLMSSEQGYLEPIYYRNRNEKIKLNNWDKVKRFLEKPLEQGISEIE